MTLPIKITTSALGTLASAGTMGGYELLRPKEISYHLIKEGNTILDTTKTYTSDTEQDDDYQSWKVIIEKYKQPNTDIKSFVTWEESSQQDHVKINKLKEKCASVLKTKDNHADFKKDLENAKKFCTKQNPEKQ